VIEVVPILRVADAACAQDWWARLGHEGLRIGQR